MSKAINKDIMSWEKFPDYDIIWCDPPWEQKMVKYFETMMYKSGQKKPNNNIEQIIKKLADLSSKEKPIFIEYSIKGSELIASIMQSSGHVLNNITNSTQENNMPYCILSFNTTHCLDGSKIGFSVIESVCKSLDFNVVFDPFAGIGKTAKSFIKNGKTYIGSEINVLRFNKLSKAIWHAQQ